MNVLVTGGAGYIGSIVTEHLLKQGHNATVLDNLQQGHKEAVLSPAEFIIGDIYDAKTLERIFRHFRIDAVMHMAADTLVGHSMTDPKRYFHNNLVGGISLLNAMLARSSVAAIPCMRANGCRLFALALLLPGGG